MPLPTIPSGNVNSGLATGYNVANSLRFNDGSSEYLHFTPSSAGNRRTMTLSVWFKGTSLADGTNNILGQYNSSNENNSMLLTIESNGRIMVWNYTTSAYTMNLRTNRLLLDPSAWYHVVVAVDTTQSTDTDRVKIYVNGVQETSFFASTYPTQNLELFMNENKAQNIGTQRYGSSVGSPFDGYMAEFCFIDGQQLAPTSFGEFDSDSPTIWKPIDVSGLTFGTNGYYLDFEDSSALGNDVSGNNNDFTPVNFASTDQATDTCTNNFCTMNPLVPTTNITFSEGNCKMVTSSSDTHGAGVGTFGLTAGRWYYEVKIASLVDNHTHGAVSELTSELYQNVTGLQNDTGVTSWINGDGGEVVVDGTATTNDYGLYTDGQIMGVALDIDNYNITYLRNGSALVSDFNMSTTRGTIFPLIKTGISTTSEVNFGGCSAFSLSSAQSDENGYGNFEHAPPSGYLAICSKNLGSDGG